MTPAPRSMPLQPYSPNVPVLGGMNGCQFAGSMKIAPDAITISTTATLMTTITRVDRRRFADAEDQQGRDRNRDQHRRQVEHRGDRIAAGDRDQRAGRGAERGGKAEPHLVQQRHQIAGPADRDRGRAQRVLEDQVPADHPGDELAERGVGVGVGGSGDRHARGELGVAEAGQRAREPGHHHGQDDRRAGVRRRGLPRQHEDAGADDRADAEHHELDRSEHALQAGPAQLLVFDLFDALGRQDGHSSGAWLTVASEVLNRAVNRSRRNP